MPQFVAMALTAAGASATAAAFISTALTIAGSMLMSQRAKKKAARQQRDAYNAAQVDRLSNIDSAISPRRMVLGRARVGGNPFFRASTGQYSDKFVMAIEMAFHEIDGVEQIYLNDVPVTLDDSGYVQTAPYLLSRTESLATWMYQPATSIVLPNTPIAGSVSVTQEQPDSTGTNVIPCTVSGNTVSISEAPSGAPLRVNYQTTVYTPKARIWWHLGNADQQADARLMALFPSLWTAAHRARGVAYLVCEFDFDETAFPNGLPAVNALVRGARVYDPRNASTAWSDNPALLLRHVFTHPYFGNKAPTADVDARIIAAANVCDTPTPYVVSGGTDTRALYTASLVVPFGNPTREAMDDLAQAMAGLWAYGRGELFVRAGGYTAPVMTLTEADLAVEVRSGDALQPEQQAASISVHRARNDKFNVANIRIWDAGQSYKESALAPVKAAALIARDGAELPREMAMPAVSYAPQAQHVASVTMRDERDALTFVAPFKLRAYPLEVGDTVALTLERYGWTAKQFIVLERVWTLQGLLQLTLKETAAAIYALDAEFLPQGYASNTELPTPWDITPPATLDIASGTEQLVVQAGAVLTRVRVAWSPVENPAVFNGGQVEVQYRGAAEDAWRSVRVPGSDTELYVTDVADGLVLLVRARYRTALAVSDWSLQQVHQVVGQTERPAAPEGFTVIPSQGFALATWNLHPAPDVRYGGQIVVRHTPDVTGVSWEGGYILQVFDGNSTTGTLPLVTGTYMAKALDAAGNWSADAAQFIATEGMVTGFTTVATTTQHPSFPGAKAGVAVTGGALRLDSVLTIGEMLTPISQWGSLGALGGIEPVGTYDFDQVLDLATVAVRRFEADMKVLAFDADDLISSRTTPISTWASIGGAEVNDCDATLYASTTNDNPAGTPSWSAWTPFMVADFNCRAARFRVELTRGLPTHNIELQQLRVAAKVPA